MILTLLWTPFDALLLESLGTIRAKLSNLVCRILWIQYAKVKLQPFGQEGKLTCRKNGPSSLEMTSSNSREFARSINLFDATMMVVGP